MGAEHPEYRAHFAAAVRRSLQPRLSVKRENPGKKMSKIAALALALSFVHPTPARAASPNQTQQTQTGVTPMTRILSLTAALALFVPVAALFLRQAALIIA